MRIEIVVGCICLSNSTIHRVDVYSERKILNEKEEMFVVIWLCVCTDKMCTS